MEIQDSAIVIRRVSPLPNGTLFAALGVLAFSLSFPATQWALEGFGPWLVAGARGSLAAILALVALLRIPTPGPHPADARTAVYSRLTFPARRDVGALLVVAAGCAIGFPLLTTFALQTASTAHSAVVIGALPMATAAIAALRTGRHPSRVFWAAAGTGAAAVIAFTLAQNRGRPTVADLYLFLALLLCAAGYAEGGRLSARMPGWRVIAWGVVFAAPVNLAVTAVALAVEPVHVTAKAVAGLAYLAAVSQFGGFVLWYRGMGEIGVARASQLQLAQPLLTLAWAVLLLGEHVGATVPLTALVVLGCIVVTQRARAD
ncbi:DMT family transporter [Actinospica durhamensis]|uniref:DMT family transporter n=1 Tax=Actinospica durhamensis TaxID=1508375 RepID=A0A941EK33_9ACTN|nr:DMT family transporter [Actinospica durhamensis]MBR7832816.1 DMT family transporter [Actinospica durhamensis]